MNETYEDEYNSEWDATERGALTRSSFWAEMSWSVIDSVTVAAALVFSLWWFDYSIPTDSCTPVRRVEYHWDLMTACFLCVAALAFALRWYGRKRRKLATLGLAVLLAVAVPIAQTIGTTYDPDFPAVCCILTF